MRLGWLLVGVLAGCSHGEDKAASDAAAVAYGTCVRGMAAVMALSTRDQPEAIAAAALGSCLREEMAALKAFTNIHNDFGAASRLVEFMRTRARDVAVNIVIEYRTGL